MSLLSLQRTELFNLIKRKREERKVPEKAVETSVKSNQLCLKRSSALQTDTISEAMADEYDGLDEAVLRNMVSVCTLFGFA